MSDPYVHEPLPYIVMVRATVNQDAAPERFEKRVMAYSAYEAIYAAIMEVSGSASDATKQCHVESVRPDVSAYLLLRLQQALAEKERKP